VQELNIPLSKPLYVYQVPMFLVTVSTVLIIDNGVVLVEKDKKLRFPGGIVKAQQETIQFAAVRHVKEQTGIMLRKDALIPVDFRSEPERSEAKNEIDLGFLCVMDNMHHDIFSSKSLTSKWFEVNFESKVILNGHHKLYMDHDVLLERSIDISLMMKE